MAFDPFRSKLISATHCDGTNGSTDFTVGAIGTLFYAYGTCALTTSGPKFGTACGNFDGGTASVLEAASGTTVAPGTSEFTVCCWIYTTNQTGTHVIFGGTQNEFALWTDGTALKAGPWTGAATVSGGTITASTWTHVAVSRHLTSAGTMTMKLFVGGTLVSSATNATNWTYSGQVRWGSSTYATNYSYYIGKLDDLQIYRGGAKYQADYAVPTAEYAEQQGPALLHFYPKSRRSFQKPIHQLGI